MAITKSKPQPEIPKAFLKMKPLYNSLEELMLDVPNGCMTFSRKMEITDSQKDNTKSNLMIMFYAMGEDKGHILDKCVTYLRQEDGKCYRGNMKRIQDALVKKFLEVLEPKDFLDDWVKTIWPHELIEAYDRAVIKNGKVKPKEGCYGFNIHGKRGSPQSLMLVD